MDFRLLEGILMGKYTLDDFFMSIKRCPLDDYGDQEGSRDVRGAKGRQNGVRNPLKEDICPIHFRGVPKPL